MKIKKQSSLCYSRSCFFLRPPKRLFWPRIAPHLTPFPPEKCTKDLRTAFFKKLSSSRCFLNSFCSISNLGCLTVSWLHDWSLMNAKKNTRKSKWGSFTIPEKIWGCIQKYNFSSLVLVLINSTHELFDISELEHHFRPVLQFELCLQCYKNAN